MKQSTLYSRILAIVFIIFLTIPGIIMLFQPAKEVSTVEKRKLAEFPSLDNSLDSIKQFPEEFENYFNDHFGLRDFYVTLYNSAFTKLFKTSPNKNVILGNEGWLYMATSGVLPDYLGQRITDDATILRFADELADRQRWFNDLGVHYLFVPVPNKIQVYPEYLPSIYTGLAGETLYEKLFKQIGTVSYATDTLNLLPLFLKKKQRRQIYYKTDTHWNFAGAYLGYQAIIDSIQQWFPNQSPLFEKDLNSFKHTYPGDLAQLLHLEKEFAEQGDDIRVKKVCEGSGIREVEWPPRSSGYKKSTDHHKVYLAECHEKDLTVFIIQDSFGNHPSRFFAQQFRKTYFFTKRDFRNVVPFIKQLKPDLVIDLHAARNLPKTLKPHPDVTTYATRKRFNEATESILELDGSNFSDNKLISQNVVFEKDSLPGHFTAITDDPQFMLPLPNNRIYKGVIIHLELDSAQKTKVQIFYNDLHHTSFIEKRSVSAKVEKGKNSLYLRLPASQKIDSLRLDPGKAPGSYTIHSFSVRNP